MDYTASPPVPLKKTLVLVNNFIIDTTRFLNHFSALAEEKLYKVSHDISRIETSLVMLESRLRQIDGLDDLQADPIPTAAAVYIGAKPAEAAAPAAAAAAPPAAAAPSAGAAAAPPPPATTAAAAPPPAPASAAPPPPADTPPAPSAPVPTMRSHPRYAKFYKLAGMNIPVEQLKPKMAMEGLNPALLDTPDAPVSAAGDDIAAELMAAAGATAGASAPAAAAAAPVAAAPPAAAAAAPPAAPAAAAPAPAAAAPAPAAPAPAAPAAAASASASGGGGGGGGTAKEDPRYAPFFRMVRMGVPLGAAMQKASVAGLDPSVLENPDGPAPP